MSDTKVAVVGSINLDVVLRVERLALPGQTVRARSIDRALGGKGANQAVAAAQRGATGLIAQLGSDPDSHALLIQLRSAGVGVTHVAASPGPSGRAHVCVDDKGENSIVVVAASNSHLDPHRVTSALTALGPAVVVVQCEVEDAVVRAVHGWADRCGVRLVFNPSPAPDYIDELPPIADPLVLNRGEAEQLAGPATTIEELALALGRRARSVVVTDGSHGAAILEGGQVRRVPAVEARVADTTGAGDAFTGVVAAELAVNSTLHDAIVTAAAEAALVIQSPRAARLTAMPPRHE